MECDHGLEHGCTYCSGKETTRVVPKPIKVSKPRKRARIDRDMVVAQRVARGELCEFCLGETAPIGCECSRRAFFADQFGNTGNGPSGSDQNAGLVQLWLLEHYEQFLPPGSADAARAIRSADRVVAGLATSTLNRAGRRAGIVRDAGGASPSDISEAQDYRLDVLARFGTEPRWHQPRTQEADYSPI